MRISSGYEHSLQECYYHIGNRGIRVDIQALDESRKIVEAEIARNCAIASNQWGCTVYLGADNAPENDGSGDVIGPGGAPVNINSSSGENSLLKKLQKLGYEVPKITKKNAEGEYESNYSAGELAIQKMLAQNQFSYPGGDPALKAILKVREFGKLRTSYLNARLYPRDGQFYFLSNYNVAGTLTGRRSSRRHTFGYGNNAQNFPEHSSTAFLFRKCLIAREGNIFLFIDQVSAEDWAVSALSYNLNALQELKSGTDRHTKLACFIFNLDITSKTPKEWKDSMERYLAKKTRHASNYDMTAPRMSDALSQEGFSYSIEQCKVLLERMSVVDPTIKTIFHKYIRDQISATRILITPEPFLRERQFLSARPDDYNNAVFKEAYAFIPQSTIGDNTGYAVLELETQYPEQERYIVQEGHDSLTQDIPDDPDVILGCLRRTEKAFNRKIRFHNGIEVQIPIEAKLGYNFKDSIKLESFDRESIRRVVEKLRDERAVKTATFA